MKYQGVLKISCDKEKKETVEDFASYVYSHFPCQDFFFSASKENVVTHNYVYVTFAQAKEVKEKVVALAKKRGIDKLCTIVAEEGVFPIDWLALNNPDWFG
jgi:hypothetical protein